MSYCLKNIILSLYVFHLGNFVNLGFLAPWFLGFLARLVPVSLDPWLLVPYILGYWLLGFLARLVLGFLVSWFEYSYEIQWGLRHLAKPHGVLECRRRLGLRLGLRLRRRLRLRLRLRPSRAAIARASRHRASDRSQIPTKDLTDPKST